MYKSLYVALDNSEHSDAAATVALALAEAVSARCIGMHAYAARMHDYRFKQMEYTLPEEYQDEAELLRQRRIHDSLITTGLQLISDSYTDVMRYRCLEREIAFEARARDGRNWEELVADINETQPDLVLMGALGSGAVKESRLGSVADRVIRRIRTDTLIVRRIGEETMRGDILVAVDGSPQSFGGLRTALALGRALHKRVEAIAVYDPYLHYAVFNGIVDVLSEKASKVFRFKEQEALHEEIIDTGLAKIYESHLRVAQAMAAEEGSELPITLLDGKAFERVARYAREREPWLLVCGRIGVHSPDGMDIGSNTDQLLRAVPCDVLVSSSTFVPPLDVRAEQSVVWTLEAEDRMQLVPGGARGLARTAVLRWCMERGHSVVSSGDVDTALDELMPYRRGAQRIEAVAATIEAAERAMVEEPAAEAARALCTVCGYAARAATPVRCPVCGSDGSAFQAIDTEALRRDAAVEGDATAMGFDGAKLGWTLEARRLLQQLPAGYLRRRVKAIIEKTARTRRLPAITADIAQPLIEPELEALDAAAGPHRAPLGPEAHTGPNVEAAPRLPWNDEARERLERIPAGFVRNLAIEQIERLALALGAPAVTRLHADAGIAEARARMQRETEPATSGGCPVHHNGAKPDETFTGLNEITAPVVDALGRRKLD
ncbi:MAG: universal stress protein [Candidatus Dormibacteraeota bacterium]|nr:universal stress protein [Candidatus Dormibacteraeota bacterium]